MYNKDGSYTFTDTFPDYSNITKEGMDKVIKYQHQKIAKKHGVILDRIEKELSKGIKTEIKQTKDELDAYIVAINNIKKNVDYYSNMRKSRIIVKSIGSVECQKLAKKHGVSVEHIKKQLNIGKKEEMEHTDRQFEARKIALDHLFEDPEYYTKLKGAGLVEKALKTPAQKKFDLVMHEFEVGALADSNGNLVTDKDQALAIAYSESGMKKSIIVKAMEYKEKLKKLIVRKAKSEKKARSGRIITIAELKRLAGNTAEYDHKYKLQGKMSWHGLNIAIENKKGSTRTGKDPDGKPWKTYMNFDYGRIGGTKGTDDESEDCYIGPDDTAEMVYVVHQNDPFTRRFDENKSMLNFPSKESAIEGYLSQYDRPDFLGPVSEYTIPEFKIALKEKRGTMLYRSPKTFRKSRIIVRVKGWD